jgi:hypothetical protein
MNMKKLNPFAVIAVAVLSLVLGACASIPQEELDEARLALENAVAVEADLYVSDLVLSAQDSLEAARIEIEEQNARSRFSRSYRRAEAMLVSAKSLAEEAGSTVAVRKEEVRVEAAGLIGEAEVAIATARELLGRTPRGKEGAIVLVSLQNDVDVAGNSLNQAIVAQQNGRHAEARDLARTALDLATSLNEEMNQAIAKTATPRS